MSQAAIDWAYESTGMDSGLKFTLVTLADECDDDGVCQISMTELALKMSASERSVRRRIDKLIENGIIRSYRQAENGRRTPNKYVLVGDFA